MTKDLAYSIGVFLGDGSIQHGCGFCLQTIDRDFAEACKRSLEKLTKKDVRLVDIPRLTSAGRQVFAIYVSDSHLCRLLMQDTGGKFHLHIPRDWMDWTLDERRELIAGLLDSEGYVSVTRLHEYGGQKVFDMKIGIGACDPWVRELHAYCKLNGILVGCITQGILKSGKIFQKFIFNKKSFIEHGLYFKIGRKQKRIEEYKVLFPGSTTRRGIPTTKETKERMSCFAKTRQRIGGRFVKVMV